MQQERAEHCPARGGASGHLGENDALHRRVDTGPRARGCLQKPTGNVCQPCLPLEVPQSLWRLKQEFGGQSLAQGVLRGLQLPKEHLLSPQTPRTLTVTVPLLLWLEPRARTGIYQQTEKQKLAKN